MEELLEEVISIVREGGSLACDIRENVDFSIKDNGTLVSEADCRVEEFVCDSLEEGFDFGVVGEEFGGSFDDDKYWLVDPIDGTKNYASGQDLYGTSVVLVDSSGPLLGGFYMPEKDDLFYACRGEGVFVNGEEVFIDSVKDFESSYIVLSGMGWYNSCDGVSSLNSRLQVLGSAIVGECWVLCGNCDLGVYSALAPWDMAFGKLIIEEAGGVMKSVDGGDDWNDVREGKCVFGSESLVDSFINKIDDDTKDIINGSSYDY